METDTNPESPDRPSGLVHPEPFWTRTSNRLRAVLVPVGIYLLVGFIIVIAHGIWPDTIPKWIIWIIAAPLIYVLMELVVHLLAVPFMLLAKIPPFSWVAWWLRCEDGEGDPVLRFAGLAFGLLAIFLVVLKLVYP